MAGEVASLREFIDRSLANGSQASLVEAIAHFDWHNHAFPSTWRLNEALAGLSAPVALSFDGMHLAITPGAGTVKLADSDLSRIIEEYTKALRSPRGA